MLKHQAIGPYEDGSYVVGYPTPGCDVITAVCTCRTEKQAAGEVLRLDQQQYDREEALQVDRALRGFRRVVN